MSFVKAIFFILVTALLTSCKSEQQTVLIVGDSWSAFMCAHKSLDRALSKAGVSNAKANATCALTTDIGARAESWRQTPFHRNTLIALKDPAVKVLYLSLGGNDMINYWKKSMSTPAFDQLIDRIKQDVADIVTIYHAERPDVKILISGYDYPRFTEDHAILAYRNMYSEMGSPTPYELNSALARLSEKFFSLNEMNQTRYMHHLGLMHYYFGNPEMGLSPKATKPPSEISKRGSVVNTYGGDLRFTSAMSAMQNYTDGELAGVIDAFHLSKKGYDYLADHSVQIYLKDWLNSTSAVLE